MPIARQCPRHLRSAHKEVGGIEPKGLRAPIAAASRSRAQIAALRSEPGLIEREEGEKREEKNLESEKAGPDSGPGAGDMAAGQPDFTWPFFLQKPQTQVEAATSLSGYSLFRRAKESPARGQGASVAWPSVKARATP